MAKAKRIVRSFHELDVFRSEARAIRRRRKVVDESMRQCAPSRGDASEGPPTSTDERPISNLVGLSLSGGGMRSASFGIGLLQELGTSGLLRYVDYLSTVSGGGYAGAILSANAHARGEQQKEIAVLDEIGEREIRETLNCLGGVFNEKDARELLRQKEWKRIVRTSDKLKEVICPFLPEPPSDEEKDDECRGQSPKLIRRLVLRRRLPFSRQVRLRRALLRRPGAQQYAHVFRGHRPRCSTSDRVARP